MGGQGQAEVTANIFSSEVSFHGGKADFIERFLDTLGA